MCSTVPVLYITNLN